MTEEIDFDSVVNWINTKWKGNKVCPICRSNDWNVSAKPVELREFHGGGLVVGGSVFPLIPVTCQVCGYTLLFNAMVGGFVQREEEKEEK